MCEMTPHFFKVMKLFVFVGLFINSCSQYNTPAQPQKTLSKTIQHQIKYPTAITWLSNNQLAAATSSSITILPAQQSALSDKTMNLTPATLPFLLISSREYIAWAEGDNVIHVQELNGQQNIETTIRGQAKITGMALADHIDQLVFSTYDNKLTIMDLDNNRQVSSWQTDNWLTNLSFANNGELIVGADLTGQSLYFFDSATGEIMRRINWFDSSSPVLYSAKISPKGNKVAWVSKSQVQIMNLENESVSATFVHEDFVNTVAWSPDGEWLATAASFFQDERYLPCVYIFDIVTGKKIYQIILSAAVIDIAFSPDGNSIATISSDGLLEVWAIK
jgi:WD40 repeat protein